MLDMDIVSCLLGLTQNPGDLDASESRITHCPQYGLRMSFKRFHSFMVKALGHIVSDP